MATVTRWDPWRQLTRMQRDIDDALQQMGPAGGGEGTRGASLAWLPPTDVAKTADAIVVRLDLPGVDQEQVQIELHDRTLVVSGERREDREQSHEGYYTRERITGAFTRSFTLPDGVEADQIGADFTDGVLTVTVPLPKETKPRRIEVSSGQKRSGNGSVVEEASGRSEIASGSKKRAAARN